MPAYRYGSRQTAQLLFFLVGVHVSYSPFFSVSGDPSTLNLHACFYREGYRQGAFPYERSTVKPCPRLPRTLTFEPPLPLNLKLQPLGLVSVFLCFGERVKSKRHAFLASVSVVALTWKFPPKGVPLSFNKISN